MIMKEDKVIGSSTSRSGHNNTFEYYWTGHGWSVCPGCARFRTMMKKKVMTTNGGGVESSGSSSDDNNTDSTTTNDYYDYNNNGGGGERHECLLF